MNKIDLLGLFGNCCDGLGYFLSITYSKILNHGPFYSNDLPDIMMRNMQNKHCAVLCFPRVFRIRICSG